MKKTAILMAVMMAALCLAPLAACGGGTGIKVDGKEFLLSDYVTDLPESGTVEGSFRKFPEIGSMKELDLHLSFFSDSYGELDVAEEHGTGSNEGMYRLYDLKREQSLTGWYTRISQLSGSPFLRLENEGGGSTVYRIAYPTGETVMTTFSDDTVSSISTDYGYYTVDGESVRYYSITYPTGSSTSTAYISYQDGAWKKLTKSDITAETSSDEYEVGDKLGIVKMPLVEMNGGSEEDYPDYIYKDYSFTMEGTATTTKITIYKDDEPLEPFFVFNGDSTALGIIGKYFYYYDRQPVSADSKNGYNLEIATSAVTEKYEATLRRYDIEEGKSEVVDTDYYFTRGEVEDVLYNKTTNDFDRLIVSAYKKAGGIAVISNGAPVYTVILDDEADISCDLTGKSVSGTFYKLSDTRYLSGALILDEKMDTVATLPGYSAPKVWKEQSLIVCSTGSGAIAVDYDGTVRIAGIQRTSGLCGKNIVGTNQDGEAAVFSLSSTTGKTLSSLIGGTYATLAGGLFYTDGSGKLTFYNWLGKKVGSFETEDALGTATTYGEKYYVSASDTYGNSVTLVFA